MRISTGCLFFLLIALAMTPSCAQQPPAITTFIMVRHAEKGNDGTDDPDLKPEGVERANKLAAMLKNTKVDAIYTTRYKRTRNTIAPLAAAKQLEVQLYEGFKPEEIEKMIERHRGGTIVVSGHSNNIPWTANLLVGKETYQAYADTDFGNLLIVSVVEKGKVANVTWLTY